MHGRLRHSQPVVMALQPGEEIGLERHGDGDQFVRVESSQGEAILDTRLARGKYPAAQGGAGGGG